MDLTESIININAAIGEAKFLLDGLLYEGEDWKQIYFRIRIENGGGHLFK